jgi:hypothetical protein
VQDLLGDWVLTDWDGGEMRSATRRTVVAGHEAGLLMLQKIARHKERLGYRRSTSTTSAESGRRLAPRYSLLLHLQGRRACWSARLAPIGCKTWPEIITILFRSASQ